MQPTHALRPLCTFYLSNKLFEQFLSLQGNILLYRVEILYEYTRGRNIKCFQ